jgi:hypothetical protein
MHPEDLRRTGPPAFAPRLEPGHVRHGHVDQDDVRAELRGQRDGITTIDRSPTVDIPLVAFTSRAGALPAGSHLRQSSLRSGPRERCIP